MNSWLPKTTSDFNLKNTTMITFMDENGIRTFKFNHGDNLMASLEPHKNGHKFCAGR